MQKTLKKAVRGVIGGIEKKYGKGAIMAMGDEGFARNIETIPSGSLALDNALGIGGYPRGRIIEIFGPESSGKTTLCLHAIANTQATGGVAAFIDAEHAFDPNYAKALGVSLDDLLLAQPFCGEEALNITEELTKSGLIQLIVIDSVAALTPKAELEGEMGQAHMAVQARLMSQALRKLTAVSHKSGTAIVFINQLRQKVGVVYGSRENDAGRQRTQVLRERATRRAAQGAHQRQRRQPDRLEDQGQGHQEQSRATVQGGRVRDPLRHGHRPSHRPVG